MRSFPTLHAMIAIIDYNAGNLASVKRAFDSLGVASCVTADADVIRHAQRIVVPGVGHAASAMATMRERGIDTALCESVKGGTPTLGICLGAQIILSRSEEGAAGCLGLIPGSVLRLQPADTMLKIPHMGWNAVFFVRPHPLFCGIESGSEFYFVHSYYPQPDDENSVVATCEYGVVFPCAISLRNLFATQFHPEKSGRTGLQILKNFASWDGLC